MIRPDAPDDYKLIACLAEFYAMQNLISEISDYCQAHPKTIEIKTSEIIDICKNVMNNSTFKLNTFIVMMQNEAETLKDKLEQLEKEKNNDK